MSKEKRILNIGCGKDMYGTDFVDLYPKRKEVKKCDIDKEKLPYKENTFDKVYSKCLLEHLKNVGFALKEMVRVLKKRGIIEIITDNASYWYYSLNNKTHTGGYESIDQIGNADKHYSLFTDWHLNNHFKDVGLEILKIEFQGNINKGGRFKWKVAVLNVINKLLECSPLKRMAYKRIRIISRK